MGQERPSGGEEPVQGSADLGGIVGRRGQVPLDVFDGRLEDVERVAQFVQLATGHHQFGLAETQLGGSPPRFVVTLLAALAAEPARPARSLPYRQLPAAPTAPR